MNRRQVYVLLAYGPGGVADPPEDSNYMEPGVKRIGNWWVQATCAASQSGMNILWTCMVEEEKAS